MKMQRTLIIIKPDALVLGVLGRIISMLEKNGLRIAGLKMLRLNKRQARSFYRVHKGKPFYKPLVEFMTSNPCFVMVIEGKAAISRSRKLMGNTNPVEAGPGTIRKLYATDNRHNAIHGSDSPGNAVKEVNFFFKKKELHGWKKKIYRIK